MNRADVTELHYITAIANLPSIMEHGILSHTLADQLAHDSVAMPEIQERRRNKEIPGARLLHEYANLYFDAHNPMLSRCRGRNNEICVLQIKPIVLDIPGVIIADRNAASDWTGFWPVNDGLSVIDRERLFARYWTHPNDLFDEMSHKSEKCAEVLVPDRVNAQFIVGAYVANQAALVEFQRLNSQLPVRIRSDMFF
jgi:ssDNA thymidine ADP-ribosyltransferase, DarT